MEFYDYAKNNEVNLWGGVGAGGGLAGTARPLESRPEWLSGSAEKKAGALNRVLEGRFHAGRRDNQGNRRFGHLYGPPLPG